MSSKKDLEYLMSRNSDQDVRLFRVYHAPFSKGLIIPKEVLRIAARESMGRKLWRLISVGNLGETELPDISAEPVTIEQVGVSIGEFMQANSIGGMLVDDNAPDEIRRLTRSIGREFSSDSGQSDDIVTALGMGARMSREDTRPWPGQYL
jgi:hypothetical protein